MLTPVFGQEEEYEKTFTSLKDALKYRTKVRKLDLSHTYLKEFPGII
ncbi:MAG: hypothetical protein IH946_00605, partial [Bacteroidetes bacterium]|nr:hypothetical protein [Bacteroidota bacterium]